jgi:hypothetical protein
MEKDCRMYHLFVGMALAATLFLTACTSRQESKLLSFYDVNRTEKLSVPFDEEGKEFAKLRDLDAREMEIKVDMPFAKAVKADYEKSAEKINSQLMEMLLKKSGSLTTEEAVEKFMQDVKNEFKREKVISIYYKHLKGYAEFGMENVLNYRLEEEEFTGGAHPYTTTTILRFNMMTGDFISLDQICPLAKRKELKEMLLAKLMKDNHVSTMEELNQLGILEMTDMFVSKNFSLGEDSIEFYYNEYDIAPYAYGPCTIRLGYEDIHKLGV